MIYSPRDFLHIDDKTTIETAQALVKTLGPEDPLTEVWIKAARQFGYVFHSDRNLFFKGV